MGVVLIAAVPIAAVPIAVVLLADVRDAIANASALTLDRARSRRAVPAVGRIGCLTVAVSRPVASVLAGPGVRAVGAALCAVRRIARSQWWGGGGAGI